MIWLLVLIVAILINAETKQLQGSPLDGVCWFSHGPPHSQRPYDDRNRQRLDVERSVTDWAALAGIAQIPPQEEIASPMIVRNCWLSSAKGYSLHSRTTCGS
jgi:hypothetical protein